MAAKNSLPDSELKIARLKNRADFLAARKGARSHGRAFVLQVYRRPADTGSEFRVGFTVTKKTGNAVERNRIKRRLRAAVEQAEFPSSCAGTDAVIIARRDLLTLPFDQLVKSLSRCFQKTHADVNRNPKHHVAN